MMNLAVCSQIELNWQPTELAKELLSSHSRAVFVTVDAGLVNRGKAAYNPPV